MAAAFVRLQKEATCICADGGCGGGGGGRRRRSQQTCTMLHYVPFLAVTCLHCGALVTCLSPREFVRLLTLRMFVGVCSLGLRRGSV